MQTLDTTQTIFTQIKLRISRRHLNKADNITITQNTQRQYGQHLTTPRLC